jgi:hypothetical protein
MKNPIEKLTFFSQSDRSIFGIIDYPPLSDDFSDKKSDQK